MSDNHDSAIVQRIFTPAMIGKEFDLLPCLQCSKESVCKFIDRAKDNAQVINNQDLLSEPFSVKINCKYFSFNNLNPVSSITMRA